MKVQTIEERLESAAQAIAEMGEGAYSTSHDDMLNAEAELIENLAKDLLVEHEGWIRCNCGYGAVKPNDGRCECGQPLGH